MGWYFFFFFCTYDGVLGREDSGITGETPGHALSLAGRG